MQPSQVTKEQMLKAKHDYYLRIRGRVESLLGGTSAAFKAYQSAYEKEVNSNSWQLGRKKDLFNQIDKSQIIYVGDFHAQMQSSRALLRIARGIGSDKVAIGLECFFIEHQKYLNQFLMGNISEREFLRKIEWKKSWGFPWEYTKSLLKWASLQKVPVYALNKKNINGLNERDVVSAKIITQILKKHPQRKLIVQYGDFHLASKHLPYQVKLKNRKIVETVILQSPEELYFKIFSRNKDISGVDFVKLTERRWALMSVVPWVKWQDYLLYLETGNDKKIRVSDYDLTDHVGQAVNIINTALSLSVSIDDLSIYSVNDEILFDKIQSLPAQERASCKEMIVSGVSFYCPEQRIGYVARPSLNQISKVAAQYVLYKLGVFTKTISDVRKDFLKSIWLEMLTYFLTKLINPKRKSDTFDDIRAALRSEQFSDKGKEALVLALEQKLNEIRYATLQVYNSTIIRNKNYKNKKSYYTASQILGGIIGEKVYTAFQKKIFKLPQQNSLLFKDLNSKLFTQSYYESVELIDSWPSSFKSKYDKF
ncbi:MAG: ChaN family lipoprotein [Pseudobdellovibrio sp.]